MCKLGEKYVNLVKRCVNWRDDAKICVNCVKIWVMGWLRLVGSLKLYVSLENIDLFCSALLQKRPMILRSLLIVATP